VNARLNRRLVRRFGGWTAAAVVISVASGCGQPESFGQQGPVRTSVLDRVEQPATSTTIPGSLPDVAERPVAPSSVAPTLAPLPRTESVGDLYVNKNTPDSPIGVLCWSRREVALSIVKVIQPEDSRDGVPIEARPISDVGKDVLVRLVQSDVANKSAAGAFASQFIDSLERFNAEVAGSLDSADTESFSKITSEYFNFESYAGVEDYVAESQKSADCPQP
jgi:hypothetical protein